MVGLLNRLNRLPFENKLNLIKYWIKILLLVNVDVAPIKTIWKYKKEVKIFLFILWILPILEVITLTKGYCDNNC